MRLSLPAICAIGLSLAGCKSPSDPLICTAIGVFAIVVTVLDGASNQRICDATVTAVEGSFSQELRGLTAGTDCAYSGPLERAGVYEVRVAKPGYEPTSMTNVRVTADECHVIPVRLTVTLNRTP